MKTKIIIAAILLFGFLAPLTNFAQCPVQKQGTSYGFFRVTNFKDKICWLSEPFGYDVDNNGQVKNWEQLKDCFTKKVEALGGDITGTERIVWLNNVFEPNPDLPSSYN